MNAEEIILAQYKSYAELKDKFVDRSFVTNKFYLVLILLLIVVMYLMRDFTFAYGLTSTVTFAAAGMAICVLWWINVDSYNFLIKVKLSKVLEELENRLPAQPYKMEISSINDLKKSKREFLFADIQKGLATLVFILFFVLFINEIVLLIMAA